MEKHMKEEAVRDPLSKTIRAIRKLRGKGQWISVSTKEVDSWSARARNLEQRIDELEKELAKEKK